MQSAVICVRVSPRPAENVRYSPDIQEQKGREWCAKNGIPVVDVVKDILVSGGAANRFESIFRAIEEHRPSHFVVSDLSRWTRDRPSRFWAMKAVLEDNDIRLVSVDEEYLSIGDMPFSDSITTIRVEANYQQRIESNRKTSAGVRQAWASGKRFGRIWGWTFDPQTRQYTHDVPRIKSFFEDFVSGMSAYAISCKYGILTGSVRSHIKARSQIDVIGEDLWQRAQARLRQMGRGQRNDARKASLYRGLLRCPHCDARMHHSASHWNHYRCMPPYVSDHPWKVLSANRYVEPGLRELTDRLYLPLDQAMAVSVALTAPQRMVARTAETIRAEIERHAVSWARGRLSEARYETLVDELEAEMVSAPQLPPTPDHQIAVVRGIKEIDLQDQDPEMGQHTNALLRELFVMDVQPDRSVLISIKPEYEHWLV